MQTRRRSVVSAVALAASLAMAAPANALSEIKPAEPEATTQVEPGTIPQPETQAPQPAGPAEPAPEAEPAPQTDPATETAPTPDSGVEDPGAATEENPLPDADPGEATEGPAVPPRPGAAPVKPDDNGGLPPAEISYDIDKLPAPVRTMRELIMEAARKGDLEALRPLIGTGTDTTQLSFGAVEGDPIEFIKGLSGDDQGHEILAILLELMESGYVKLDAGSESEIYVWPYFTGIAIDKLTPQQRIELFKIITAGDFEDMKTYGAYIFYRVGISPNGKWQFFVAGD